MRSWLVVFFMVASLSGCGSAYKSPKVAEGQSDSGVNVDVVSLTFSSADFANRLVPYTPKPLPTALREFGPPRLVSASSTISPVLTEETRLDFEGRWPDPLPVQTYRIGVGDTLLFSPPTGISAVAPALSQPGLDAAAARRQAYSVQGDGAISIPDIGRIRVVGLTLPEAEQAIFEALLERQKEPSFSIEIADFNSQRVEIAGLVAQPTSIPITLKPLYLRETLAAAGGAKIPNVEDGYIALYRDGETYRMLLSDVYSNSSLGRQVLKDGDSIYVGALYSEERAVQYLDDQLAIFQAQSNARNNDRIAIRDQIAIGSFPQDRVYLVGEVDQQVSVPLPLGHKAMLSDVLFNPAGRGFDMKTANFSQIYVLRFSDLSRRVTAYHLDASNIGNLVVASKLEMRPNDFVFIAEQPITAWNRVVQQLVPSIFFGAINTARN